MEPAFQRIGVSIVIPYYNDLPHVTACLRSIKDSATKLTAGQRKNLDVIIVDDHSPDALSNTLVDLPYVIHRQSSRMGTGAARNKGVELARNPYILFMDSDVVLDKAFLPCMFDILSNNPMIKVLQGPHSPKPAGTRLSLFQHYLAISWNFHMSQEFLDARGEPSLFYSGLVVMSKDFYLSTGGFSEACRDSGGEEFDLSARLSDYPPGTVIYNESLVSYHHFDNLRHRLRKLWWRSRYYLSTLGKVRKLPFGFKLRTIKRLSLALAMSLSILLVVLNWKYACLVYALLYLLSALTDVRLASSMGRSHSWQLSCLYPLYSQLEYTVVGTSMCLNMFRFNHVPHQGASQN